MAELVLGVHLLLGLPSPQPPFWLSPLPLTWQCSSHARPLSTCSQQEQHEWEEEEEQEEGHLELEGDRPLVAASVAPIELEFASFFPQSVS